MGRSGLSRPVCFTNGTPLPTYIREPPFFMDFPIKPAQRINLKDLRVLAYLGDSITTDHISPAGEFSRDSPFS